MDQNIKRWIGASVCCFIIGSGQGIMAHVQNLHTRFTALPHQHTHDPRTYPH